MTQEEKAKAYDEVLKAAVVAHKDEDRHLKATLERIFPELAESEDEKIRKSIIHHIKFEIEHNIIPSARAASWIAYLEKQGKENPSPKQGEQKPADKAEPKFKIGVWVVYDGWTCQITDVKEDGYCNDHNGFIPKDREDDMRLWTIQDAKDGDVLATQDSVFIFKHIDKTGRSLCKSYCEVIGNSGLGLGFEFSINGIYPATKEQRDQLKKAISDAGYTFDFEKKKLKKIEQKLAWSEEDETNASYICAALDCYYRLREERNNTNGQEDLDKARNWLYNKLKSLRPQSKRKWSEDDKKKYIGELQSLMLEWSNRKENMGICIDRHINKLLSLHPQS